MGERGGGAVRWGEGGSKVGGRGGRYPHFTLFLYIHLLPSSVRSLSTPNPQLTKPLTKEEARLPRAESTWPAVLNPAIHGHIVRGPIRISLSCDTHGHVPSESYKYPRAPLAPLCPAKVKVLHHHYITGLVIESRALGQDLPL